MPWKAVSWWNYELFYSSNQSACSKAPVTEDRIVAYKIDVGNMPQVQARLIEKPEEEIWGEKNSQ